MSFLSLLHYSSKIANTLASLVKGEMLSPEKIRATTGGIAFLPHPFRFSDTSVNNPSIVGGASRCNRSSPLHKGAKGDSALPTIPKPHYPSKIANTLASLVKGRWIDGKAQTVALLRFACDTSAFFIHQTFCRQDGGIATSPFAQHHIYASLVKGRWIGGKAQTLTLLHLLAICPPFLYCKLFCRQDGGIATPPTMPRTTPSKTVLSHSLFVGEWACPSRCTNPCCFR